MSFVNAVRNQEARTDNGMKARKSTADNVVDLFYKIGASRGKDILPAFAAAYAEDRELALRIALWARDVRGGAGERQLFKDIMAYLETVDQDAVRVLMNKAPHLGRWDDIFDLKDPVLIEEALTMLEEALIARDGLAAKWTPRKGDFAIKLRKKMGYTPKRYRKTLVTLSKTVEQQMCAKEWDGINFSHVPSVAASRYKKAFYRNTPKYKEYVEALVAGKTVDGKEVKVNASSIYPYDVIKDLVRQDPSWRTKMSKTEIDLVIKQWEALPNYVGDSNVLAMVDVSGSMIALAGGNGNVSCMDVAVSLGLYVADKNKGPFKDTFLTFSGKPELLYLKGNISSKITQMTKSKWSMNTNVVAAFRKILDVAREGDVKQEDMPNMLLIMSDMQFDNCVRFDDSALESVRREYEAAGYVCPQIVFWNINSRDNVPAKSNEQGVALVSGFSPSIMKAVLSANMDEFTPRGIMMKSIMNEKYAI